MSKESSEKEELSDWPDVSSSHDPESLREIRQVSISRSRSAPIPPPGDFERYEAILPGAADRILTMAEKAQGRRHDRARMALETERLVVQGESRRSFLGVVAAFIISLLCIGGGVYLIANGQVWAGTALVGFDLAGLVAVFIYGTNSRRTEFRGRVEDTEEE